MKRRERLGLGVLILAVLMVGLACACRRCLPAYYPPFANPICLEAPYSPPPPTFQESDLLGTWDTRYSGWPGGNVDRLILRGDSTFKQVYEDYDVKGYVYETPWNEWWLERLPDGRVRVHLQGARYYAYGISTAELDGLGPCPTTVPGCTGEPFPLPYNFYDPFAHDYLHMAGELVLNVRVDSSGELLLHHMWYTSDRGFIPSECESEHFRRVETP